jgi:hypothetical protein
MPTLIHHKGRLGHKGKALMDLWRVITTGEHFAKY